MTRRLAAAAVAVLLAGLALAGCSRFAGDPDNVPASPVPSTEGAIDDLAAVEESLNSIDESLAESQQDAAAGDEAAATTDQP